ncbi:peptide deformylase [Phormidesmis priestleyi ULC007]|uniref:Peptide deformylase n=1 Tax=Phormidesmis priestleyi ULC007 TaxID=1920490 RepID=A0A2T1DL55_9CYAN|nr:peptide deformylase [Phormidesmis priestleyi]PSB21181.1 peptide deformylase [Phormidesmis priestleyi ULC007]PZO51292.1 MAG: peptide deformylase [Phormidesmis priestleyi]
MSEPLEIIELGHPILRQTAQPILNVQDQTIQTLIDDLLLTVKQANGVGIAAPQVARSSQLMIVASRPNPRYPTAPEMQPTAILNPRILSHSTETVIGWEGCLSIPGIRGKVPRYQAVEIEYTDRNGTLQKMEMTNFIARIFQHEFDHFNGMVFLDRVETTEALVTEKEYQRQMEALAKE